MTTGTGALDETAHIATTFLSVADGVNHHLIPWDAAGRTFLRKDLVKGVNFPQSSRKQGGWGRKSVGQQPMRQNDQ
jgi:hypothetical protein